MLIFNVLEATLFDASEAPGAEPDDFHYVSDLIAVGEYLSPDRLRECLIETVYSDGSALLDSSQKISNTAVILPFHNQRQDGPAKS
jgi:hypothetical protein